MDLISDMIPYYDIVSLNWTYWIYGLGYLDIMDPLVHETVGYVRPVKILTYLEPEQYKMVDKT